MTTLITLLSAAPTGYRHSNGTVPAEIVEGARSMIPDGKEPIGYYVKTTEPLWENPMFILVLALIGIVVIFALALFVGMWLTRRDLSRTRRHHDINRLIQEERAYMQNDLFDAAADITRISAMHNLHGRRRR